VTEGEKKTKRRTTPINKKLVRIIALVLVCALGLSVITVGLWALLLR